MIKRRIFSMTGAMKPLLFAALLMAGCNGNAPKTVTDIDGNSYGTVKIGQHVWMTENLRVSRYRNGDPVPEVKDAASWAAESAGARCSYGNDAENGKSYGMLYNWRAVSDPRGLAPEGWHVATDKEWGELAEALGGEQQAGAALKAPGKWKDSTGDDGESSGFDALPSGARRDADGEFLMLGQFARFWTSTPAGNGKALARALGFYDNALRGGEVGPKNGFAVRCVKD
ncbi:MAG: fibrobacter succinogenes major paralogous domain-containing protein [Chlorobaculum sp.]